MLLLCQHTSLFSSRPAAAPVPSCTPAAPNQLRSRSVQTRFAPGHHQHHNDFGRQRFPQSEGLPLSLFHRYTKLPPEGTTLPLEEEICDPEEQSCKTPLHVYEARCTACSGTGWARAPSNGRRGHLGTCMVCHGLGFVRRTTSRFCPDDPDKHMTIARPLTWNGKFAARMSRPSSSNGHNSGNGTTTTSSWPGSSSSNNNGSSQQGSEDSNGSSNGSSQQH